MKKRIAIFGFKDSSVGQILLWLKSFTNYEIDFLISIHLRSPYKKKKTSRVEKKIEIYKNNKIFGKKIYFTKNYIELLKRKKIYECMILEDDPLIRYEIYKNLKKNRIKLITFVHPNVFLGSLTKINEGAIIYPGSYIGYKTTIGKCTIVGSRCNLEHHNFISDFVNINPNVNTGGFVEIKKFSIIGISVNIINAIQIGYKTFIGAGSLVLKNCKNNKLFFGHPAKIVNKIN